MTEQQLSLLTTNEPPETGVLYRGYTVDTPPEDAVAAFIQRYGTHPAQVTLYKMVLYVGPIPAKAGVQ